jgi:hypothetical protein
MSSGGAFNGSWARNLGNLRNLGGELIENLDGSRRHLDNEDEPICPSGDGEREERAARGLTVCQSDHGRNLGVGSQAEFKPIRRGALGTLNGVA